MGHMNGRLVFIVLVLLACAPIDDALAGHGSSQSGNVHSVPRHATSLHHGARGADISNGTYHSELLHSRSEWRQVQRGRTGPSPVQTAAQ